MGRASRARLTASGGADGADGSARPRRRHEQAEWRRERLLDAALSVFGRRGPEAASMRDVATAAGVTPGLLYHYFDSKEELALALIRERGFSSELHRILDDAGHQSAAEMISDLVARCTEFMSHRGDLLAFAISGAVGNTRIREGLQAQIAEGHQLLGDYLRAAVERGELREHDTTTVAHMLLAPVALAPVVGVSPDPAAVAAVLIDYLVVEPPAVKRRTRRR